MKQLENWSKQFVSIFLIIVMRYDEPFARERERGNLLIWPLTDQAKLL